MGVSFGGLVVDRVNVNRGGPPSFRPDDRPTYDQSTDRPHQQVRRAMAKERAKVVMSLLGLAGCSETIIGDHTHRGVRSVRPSEST